MHSMQPMQRDSSNQRGGARNFRAVRGIEWFFQPAEQGGQLANALCTARRALIDVGLAVRDGLRIRPAARVAALGALGLRQQRIDRFDEFLVHCGSLEEGRGRYEPGSG
jgi:hypothetical protein